MKFALKSYKASNPLPSIPQMIWIPKDQFEGSGNFINMNYTCEFKNQKRIWTVYVTKIYKWLFVGHKTFFEDLNIKDFNLKSKQNEFSYHMTRLKEAKSKTAVEITMLHLQTRYLVHHNIFLQQVCTHNNNEARE